MRTIIFVISGFSLLLFSCSGTTMKTTVVTFTATPSDWVSAGGPAGSPDNGFRYNFSTSEVTLDVLNNGDVDVELFYPVPINEFVGLPLVTPAGSTSIKYGYIEGQIYIIIHDMDLDVVAPTSNMNFKASISSPA